MAILGKQPGFPHRMGENDRDLSRRWKWTTHQGRRYFGKNEDDQDLAVTKDGSPLAWLKFRPHNVKMILRSL